MPLFFGLHRPVEALVDIVALTGTTAYLTYVWGQVDVVAGWALAPYVAWLTFATYLTVSTSFLSEYSKEGSLMLKQAGAGHLNNWNFADKERSMSKKRRDSSKYVNEATDKNE